MADINTNTYQTPNIVLGDTFLEWMSVTNNSLIGKLNLMRVYSATGGDGISATTNSNGQVVLEIADIITKGITFAGNVTFNGTVTKINSTDLTIDDYTIELGSVDSGAGTADTNIGGAGGGGIVLKRIVAPDAMLLWNYFNPAEQTQGIGASGAWKSNQYLAVTGGVGFLSPDDGVWRFKSGVNGTGPGVYMTTIAGPGNSGATLAQNSFKLSHMSTTGGSLTSGIYLDADGMVRIYDGVNKKLVTQSAHGYTFGQSLRILAAGGFTLANALSKEDAEVFGVVSEVLNVNEFVLTMNGEIKGDFGAALGAAGSNLTRGGVYFLSATGGTFSGTVSNTEPTEAPLIRKPMMLGLGATHGYILQYIAAQIAADAEVAAPVVRRISIRAVGSIISGSSGITSALTTLGTYSITHNFNNSTNYSIVGSVIGTGGMVSFDDKGDNGITAYVRDASGNLNSGFTFDVIIGKDV